MTRTLVKPIAKELCTERAIHSNYGVSANQARVLDIAEGIRMRLEDMQNLVLNKDKKILYLLLQDIRHVTDALDELEAQVIIGAVDENTQ